MKEKLYSLATGIAVGIVLHYFLYRIFLPVEPFIYVSF
jgi:xanthosine utilization system XapX-like protein